MRKGQRVQLVLGELGDARPSTVVDYLRREFDWKIEHEIERELLQWDMACGNGLVEDRKW